MPSNHLILCHPLLLLPSIFPSIRVFSKESVLRIRWPKYWSFSFNISLSNEYSGLISLRIDWFDLLAVEGTLKNFLQHHSSKASVLQCSAFFIVQLSHPYMTTGKTIALTRWDFVGKVMSLFFNMLSRLVIASFIRALIPFGEGNGTPLQYSCLENPMDGGAWVGCSPWGRYKSDTTERLHFHFSLSCIGEGNGNPLQCSCLENPRDGGAWWAVVYGVVQSRTRLKRLSSSSNTICEGSSLIA